MNSIAFRKKYFRAAPWLLAAGLLLAAGSYVWLNFQMHSDEWIASHLEASIQRGLDYLHQEGSFRKNIHGGGQPAGHHYFLNEVLALHPHPGLTEQMRHSEELNRDYFEWKAYQHLRPGDTNTLTDADKLQIRYAVRNSPNRSYDEWMVHAFYPDWTELAPEQHDRLFGEASRLKTTYDLTHALLAYLWLKESSPSRAVALGVDARIPEVVRRIYRIQRFAVTPNDTYFERLVLLYMAEQNPQIQKRWIERILESQNRDGGWTWSPSYAAPLRQLLRLGPEDRRDSDPHPTFLALYVLTHYQQKTK